MGARTEQKLELLRRYSQEAGIPVDCADKLAFSIPRAARMLDLTPKTLNNLLIEDGIPVIDLGPRNKKILTTDLVDFLFARRVNPGEAEGEQEPCENIKAEVLAALRN